MGNQKKYEGSGGTNLPDHGLYTRVQPGIVQTLDITS
jgi:hypothetical protein